MNPEVWTTRKPRKYIRRNKRTTRTVCVDLQHARNLSKSNMTDIDAIRISVWVSEDTRYVWTRGIGWSQLQESNTRANWLKSNPIF